MKMISIWDKKWALNVFLMLSFLWLGSLSVYADQGQLLSPDTVFTDRYTSDEDVSRQIICQLFSPLPSTFFSCPGVGTGRQALWTSFSQGDIQGYVQQVGVVPTLMLVFNLAAMAVLVVMYAYSAILFTISTRENAEPLYVRASPFSIARKFAAAALLWPQYQGYSVIQLFVLWVVMQSVHVANYTWFQLSGYSGLLSASAEQYFQDVVSNDGSENNLKLMKQLLSGDTQSGSNVGSINAPCDSKKITMIDLLSMSFCNRVHEKTITSSRFGVNFGCGPNGKDICFGRKDRPDQIDVCGRVAFPSQQAMLASQSTMLKAEKLSKLYFDTDLFYKNPVPFTLTKRGQDEFKGCSSSAGVACDQGACLLSKNLGNMAQSYASDLIRVVEKQEAEGFSALPKSYAQNLGWAGAGQFFWSLVDGQKTQTKTTQAKLNACSCSSTNAQSSSLTPYCQSYCMLGEPVGNAYKSGQTGYISRSSYCQNKPDRWGFSDNDRFDDAHHYRALADKMLPYLTPTDSKTQGPSYMIWQSLNRLLTSLLQPKLAPVQGKQLYGLNTTSTSSSRSTCRVMQSLLSNADASKTADYDPAMANMTLSVYMVLERILGIDLLSSNPYLATNGLGYAKMSERVGSDQLFNPVCVGLVNAYQCDGSGQETLKSSLSDIKVGNGMLGVWSSWAGAFSKGDSPNFISSMAASGCLPINGLSHTDISRLGLMGSLFAHDNPEYMFDHDLRPVDPSKQMLGVGWSMLFASIYYYFHTFTQTTHQLLTASTISSFSAGAMKMFMSGINFVQAGKFNNYWSGFSSELDHIVEIIYNVYKVGVEMFLPLGSTVAALLLSQGFILAVYLPFFAFFYYSFGVVGWFISVIEALFAAPLIALGMSHPKGHDFMGQAEQSIMLFVALFIRPISLVLGLIFAIKSSELIIGLVNQSFMFALQEYIMIMSNTTGVVSDAVHAKVVTVALVGVFMVYTYIVYTILESTYSLIYQIPERILKWVGVGVDSGDLEEKLRSIKQGFMQTGQSLSRGAEGVGPLSTGHVRTSNQGRRASEFNS